MTGNAFLKRLLFQLDFLSPDEKETVTKFYRRKLSEANSFTEEEQIVKTFGSPDHIACKLKEAYLEQKRRRELITEDHFNDDNCNNAFADQITSIPNNNSEETSDSDETVMNTKESVEPTEQEDVIFSKPLVIEKAPEIIHSLENKEVKTLYGEKVILAHDEPQEQPEIDPMDEVNGLSAEEIDYAKAQTLLKAKNYQTCAFGASEDNDFIAEKSKDIDCESEDGDEAAGTNLSNEIELEILEEDKINEDALVHYPGFFNQLFASKSEKTAKVLTILLSVLLSPLLLLFITLWTGLYLVSTVFVVLFSVTIFLLMIALIIGGIIELVYGFTLLTETVSIAFIEIGVGTILLSIVTCAVAFIYEFLFTVLPKVLKGINRLFTRRVRILFAWLYGGSV